MMDKVKSGSGQRQRTSTRRKSGFRRHGLLFLIAASGYATARPSFLPFKVKQLPHGLSDVIKVRGGSTVNASQEQQHQQHENLLDPYYTNDPFQPPQIDVSQMALALRWTAEVNRKLQLLGTKSFTRPVQVEERLLRPPSHHCLSSSSSLDPLRGGGDTATSTTTVVPQHTTYYRIPLVKQQQQQQHQESLHSNNIFQAQSPDKSKTGVARWGPDLEQFLNRLVDVLNIDNDDDSATESSSSLALLELSLAMLYLDRACSVETARDNHNGAGSIALPFCTPQTVHRLVLTAMLVSVSAVRGMTDNNNSMLELYFLIENAFGIPARQCEAMVYWMRQALGTPGIFVTPEQMREWKTMWESRFR